MVDYGPGDEIVCVREIDERHRQNASYLCIELIPPVDLPDLDPTDLQQICVQCGETGFNVIGVLTDNCLQDRTYTCACRFRKKLDFKKLCNVDASILEPV